MAWYLEHLLKNKVEIKSKSDLESDEYNDLLVIEKKINDLHGVGVVSDKELVLINYVEDGKTMSDSKYKLGMSRLSLAKNFKNLCNKIAFYVGGSFTDDGYADYMKTKYNLTDKETARLLNYMKSKYKNKLIRKTNDE